MLYKNKLFKYINPHYEMYLVCINRYNSCGLNYLPILLLIFISIVINLIYNLENRISYNQNEMYYFLRLYYN